MTLQNDLSVGMNLEVVRSYSILKKDGRENNDLSYSNKGVTLFLCYVKLQSFRLFRFGRFILLFRVLVHAEIINDIITK